MPLSLLLLSLPPRSVPPRLCRAPTSATLRWRLSSWRTTCRRGRWTSSPWRRRCTGGGRGVRLGGRCVCVCGGGGGGGGGAPPHLVQGLRPPALLRAPPPSCLRLTLAVAACRLDHLRFYEQARLILKPTGCLAIWCGAQALPGGPPAREAAGQQPWHRRARRPPQAATPHAHGRLFSSPGSFWLGAPDAAARRLPPLLRPGPAAGATTWPSLSPTRRTLMRRERRRPMR